MVKIEMMGIAAFECRIAYKPQIADMRFAQPVKFAAPNKTFGKFRNFPKVANFAYSKLIVGVTPKPAASENVIFPLSYTKPVAISSDNNNGPSASI